MLKAFSKLRQHALDRFAASSFSVDTGDSLGGCASIQENQANCITLPFSQAFSTYGPLLTKTFEEDIRAENDPLFLFSLAKHNDGLFIYVPPGVRVDSLSLVHKMNEHETSAMTRVHVVLGKGSSLFLNESFSIHSAPLCVAHMTCELEAGARLFLHSLAHNSQRLMTSYRSVLKEGASFTFTCAQEALVSKGVFRCKLQGKGSSLSYTDFSHIACGAQSQRYSLVEHASRETTSHKHIKKVIADGGTSHYTGKVVIHKEGKDSSAKQMHRALTLGPKATCYASPLFDIYQNEAQATHGSTISPLNEDLLFYARARGLSCDDAEHFMLRAFCDDILKAFPSSTRELLEKRLT